MMKEKIYREKWSQGICPGSTIPIEGSTKLESAAVVAAIAAAAESTTAEKQKDDNPAAVISAAAIVSTAKSVAITAAAR